MGLELAVRVVGSVEEAVDAYQPLRHAAQRSYSHRFKRETRGSFQDEVDAAAVYVNASTRFTDGFVFGFGAEIGISTQKLHARGPMGLAEITTYKYLLEGAGSGTRLKASESRVCK